MLFRIRYVVNTGKCCDAWRTLEELPVANIEDAKTYKQENDQRLQGDTAATKIAGIEIVNPETIRFVNTASN